MYSSASYMCPFHPNDEYEIDSIKLNYNEQQEYISHDDVRIIPGNMMFLEAFDGRKYKEKLVIQNCGRNTAFVRMCPPTSYAFKINPFVRGQMLPPGLSIVRYIEYTHLMGAGVPMATLPIHINEREFDYKLIVTLSTSRISVSPRIVDFGIINTGETAKIKTVLIKNDGTKASRFAVDLGRNSVEMVVKPMKGVVEPKSEVILALEVMRFVEGTYNQEFWIKCDKPQCVHVTVQFITPKISILNTPSCQLFYMLDFSRTYFGNKSTRSLVVKNESSADAMFCIMAEAKLEELSFEKAVGVIKDYGCFHVSPLDGRLGPNESCFIEIVFTPKKVTKTANAMEHMDYALCMLRIIRVNYTDLFNMSIEEVQPEIKVRPHPSTNISLSSSFNQLYNQEFANIDMYEFLKFKENTPPEINISEQIQRVCLHGMFETPAVSIIPDKICILEMKLNESEMRVISISNKSKNLPIVYKYKKANNVKIEPDIKALKPNQSIEASVIISATTLGKVQLRLIFELLYPNIPKIEMDEEYVTIGKCFITIEFEVKTEIKPINPKFNLGITPRITHEVGFLTDEITFNSSIEKPRMAMLASKPKRGFENDVIAFPNDRPKSLRLPKTNLNFRTIFAGIPRVRSSYVEQYKEKMENTNNAKKPKLAIENRTEYETSRKKNFVLQCMKCKKASKESVKVPSFIPLNPMQLYNVKVYPRYIDLARVATCSRSTAKITIHNFNNFEIRVLLRANHENITFVNKERFVINGSDRVVIKFSYYAVECGRNYQNIDLILNENHFLRISVQVLVLPRVLRMSVDELHFISSEECTKSVELENMLNVSIPFHWETTNSSYTIEPKSGYVRQRSTITCFVNFTPSLTAPLTTEFILTSETPGFIQILKLSATLNPPQTVLQTQHFIMDNIPLNTPTTYKFFLKNIGNEDVCFSVLKPNPIEGIKIEPHEGIMHGASKQYFKVFVLVKACVSFTFKTSIVLQRVQTVHMKITGNVIFPNITINPEVLKFNKVMQFTLNTIDLSITNPTNALCTIKFDLSDYPGFHITSDKWYSPVPDSGIVLDPLETEYFTLHINPVDIAAYNFCIPYVLNGMIGPRILKSTQTWYSLNYLSPWQDEYINKYSATPTTIPLEIPSMKIEGAVAGQLLQVSSYHIRFEVFPNVNTETNNIKTLEIKNISNDNLEICMRIDDISSPFSITLCPAANNIILPAAMLFLLKPSEEIAFEVSFSTRNPGKYSAVLPIYVRSFGDGLPFNCVRLEGEYYGAIITTLLRRVYLEPIPIGCKTLKTVELTLKYHFSGCCITAETDSSFIVHFPNGTTPDVSMEETTIEVILEYISTETKNIKDIISFSCTCNAYYELTVRGVVENCLLTTHAFVNKQQMTDSTSFIFPHSGKLLQQQTDDNSSTSTCPMKNYPTNCNETCFPFFPDDTDDSPYAKHMRQTLTAVEMWVYEQGFYNQQFYTIPEGMATFPAKVERQDEPVKSKKVEIVVLTYVQLLTNLAGEKVKNYVMQGIAQPTNNVARVKQMCKIYERAKILLESKEGFLPHVRPEHLLDYKDYTVYAKCFYEKDVFKMYLEPIMKRYQFYLRSTQSWLDLLLQTYKVFVLNRIETTINEILLKEEIGQKATSKYTVPSQEFLKIFESQQIYSGNIHGYSGTTLLIWLQHGYEMERKTLWRKPLEERSIKSFQTDLSDSIVLACITAYYCPYLKPYMQNFCLHPCTNEEYIHNAAELIKVWDLIHCCMKLIPSEISEPNIVKMKILVNYLYEYIPTLYPTETVELEKIKHCAVGEKIIPIYNLNEFPIHYKTILFGDEYKQISVEPSFLTIPPNNTGNVKVSYHARNYCRVGGILIICGDVGDNYSQSKTYSINACPDISTLNNTVEFYGSLYDMFEVSFELKCPYKITEPTAYDIAFEISDSATNIDDFKLLTWQNFKALSILPQRIFNPSNKIVIAKTGTQIMNTMVCPLIPMPKTVRSFYLNSEIGDFSLEWIFDVTVDAKKSQFELLEVQLPRDFENSCCTCDTPKYVLGQCPKFVALSIPTKNHLLWKCIEKMILVTESEENHLFWQRYANNDVGIHIMQYDVENLPSGFSSDVRHIFDRRVSYTVEPLKTPKPSATLPSNITINDTLEEGSLQVLMHIDSSDHPNNFFFTMVSQNKKEMRYYHVKFLKATP